ncbi:hypothetical protein [Pseudonocardia sp. GCM10023141]|uniref:hypothetical protein n=1 Tax=Pseudonocardia sp. GCM10023141 TaxID=3252653 RepID=UPI00361D2EC0
MTAPTRPATGSFALRYAAPLRPLMVGLGMGPAHSAVDVSPEQLRVRMGWAFRATIPLGQVRHAEHCVRPLVLGWGVHGWGGRWLVNASSEGIVRIDLDPPVRVVAAGVPVRLTTLLVGLADPDAFLATLGEARAAGHG